MSSTNKTANYQLSQFVGTDIPSILNDYNGDMRKIDSAIHNASVAGGDNATAIAELQTSTARMNTEIGGINSTVNILSGKVVGIEEVIPATASAQNKLLTAQELPEIPSIEGLETEVASLREDYANLEQDMSDKFGSAELNSHLNYNGEQGTNGCVNLLYDGWHKLIKEFTAQEVTSFATYNDLLEAIRPYFGQIGGAYNVPFMAIQMNVDGRDLTFRVHEGGYNSSTHWLTAIVHSFTGGVEIYTMQDDGGTYSLIKTKITNGSFVVTDLSQTAPSNHKVCIFA